MNSPLKTSVVTTLAILGLTAAVLAADQYVAVDGKGDRSGSSWDNARDGKSLQAAIDAAGGGDSVYIGSGNYDTPVVVGTGGTSASAAKLITGRDTGGGSPVFKSNFTKENSEKSGKIMFDLKAGVKFVALRDIKFQNVRSAVRLAGSNTNITIQNLDVNQSRDAIWIEGAATADDPQSGSHDLVVKDCKFTLYTKRGIRILEGVWNLQVTNCHADAGGRDWAVTPFPIGFHVLGGEKVFDRDITFTDCTASNNTHENGEKYWNADGFCSERNSRNLTFIRCGAFDNTDGGWDLKSASNKFVDCISIGNKRNYRIWTKTGDEKTTFENCLSAFSKDRSPNAHDTGFWFLSGGEVDLTRCTSWGDRISIKTEQHGTASAKTVIKLDRTLIATAAGGKTNAGEKETEIANQQSVIGLIGEETPSLKNPRPEWRGGDDAFNPKSGSIGYEHRSK